MISKSFSSQERKIWIDNAKAIGIILIILGHVSSRLTGWLSFEFVYGFHVAIFFVLSGYTIKKRPISLDFLTQKFKRLMLPYFSTCLVVLILDVFNEYVFYDGRSIEIITDYIAKDITRSFFGSGTITNFGGIEFESRIGAIWFLPALFFAIIIFQLLVNVVHNNKALGFVSLFISLLGFLTAKFIWLPFSVQSGLFAVFFLWIGYIVKAYELLLKVKPYHYVIALFVLAGGIYMGYCSLSFVSANANDLLISPFVGLSGCLIVYLIAIVTQKVRFLTWIGRNSLYILCVHLISLETFGGYYKKFLNLLHLSGQSREWVYIVLELLVSIIGTFLFFQIKERLYVPVKNRFQQKNLSQGNNTKRDSVVDVARGLLIISMLIGHFEINSSLRNMIYSCHMIAFVFLSGYCYKKKDNIGKSIGHVAKTFLRPYFICFLLNILVDYKQWSGEYFLEVIKKYFLGISFSRKLFPEATSVGPVYFILMLFVIRVLYMLLDKYIYEKKSKWIAVVVCMLIGIFLGNHGVWLPWSIDVALYSLIFYHMGVAFRKFHFLEWVSNNPWVYFALSPVWAYMIYQGGMEIAVRQYKPYGLVVIGSMCGIVIVYIFSAFLKEYAIFNSAFLQLAGRTSIVLLVVHGVFRNIINHFLGMYFDPNGFALMVLSIGIQIIATILIKLILDFFSNKWKKSRNNPVNSV